MCDGLFDLGELLLGLQWMLWSVAVVGHGRRVRRGYVRTFLGARREEDDEDPWDERMEDGSSAMVGDDVERGYAAAAAE